MISYLLTLPSRFCKSTLRLATLLSLTGLAAVSSARAATTGSDPANVVPGDTFSVEAFGYYITNPSDTPPSTEIPLFTTTLMPTFGKSTSYTGAALGNQTLTVNSIEYFNSGYITDYFTVSVPSNFVPTGTTDKAGNFLNTIEFSIGNYQTGTNPLNLSQSITTYTASGTVNYINNGMATSTALNLTSTLTSNGTAFSTDGSAYSTPLTQDISGYQISSFTVALTYAVPEPSTTAAVALGAAGLCLVVVRRRRTRA